MTSLKENKKWHIFH